jgi:hypothetical protein
MSNLNESSVYRERILPGIAFYVAALFIPVALFLVALPFDETLPFLVAIGSYLLILLASYLAAPVLSIDKGNFKAGKATIPLSDLGKALVIAKKDQFLERGNKLDQRAFIRFQVGVKGLVKIEVVDAKDPTPYWLVATRHPEVLVGHLNAKR